MQAALYIQTSKPKVSNKQTVNQTVDHVSYLIELSCVIIPELEKRFLRKLFVVVAKQYTIPDLVHSKGEVILTVETRTHTARNSKVDFTSSANWVKPKKKPRTLTQKEGA